MSEINAIDLRIDIYSNSSMPSARYKCGIDSIRITHRPTGIVVTCNPECQKHEKDLIIDARACAMAKLMEMMCVS